MRVLHLIESLTRSGAEQSLAAILPALSARDVDSEVGYLFERHGLRDELIASGYVLHSLSALPRNRLAYVRGVAQLISQTKPDLVHTTLFETDVAGRIAGRVRGVPVVSSLVNTAYGPNERAALEGVPGWRISAAQFLDGATAPLASRLHAVTPYVADVMSHRLRIPRNKIEVIPRGRDPETLGTYSLARRQEVRARLGVAESTPLVLAAARMEAQKGLDVLLRALPQVVATVPDVRLLVAGREGSQTPELNRLIGQLGLDDSVTLLGMRDDVPDLMVAADVFAFPSRWEGAGGTLIEAMALGCPIVSSDLETLSELVDDSTARLTPVARPDLLAESIVAVLDDPAEAEVRADLARERFASTYTIDAAADQMVQFYARAVG
jgi:glycosyltransferase involved in cell wall biosynthesis